jgi:hypothetical protein
VPLGKAGKMPLRKGKDKEKEPQKAEKCGGCAKVVEGSQNAIQCEICDKWYHTKCQDISDEAYKGICEIETLHWYCKTCNASVEKSFAKIQARVDKIEAEFRAEIKKAKDKTAELAGELNKQAASIDKVLVDFKGELAKNSQEIGQLNVELAELREGFKQQGEGVKDTATQETKWADIVNKQVKAEIGNVNNRLESVHKSLMETKEHAEEEKEKEMRRNNIIIYRAAESREITTEGRYKDDREFCLKMVSDVLGVESEMNDLKRVIRLGKKEDAKDRPVLIEFRTSGIKNRVMESLSKLRDATEEYKKLSLVHDMTKKERLECKGLVEDAKQRESADSSGEFIYRVRGNPGNFRILKLRKH